MQLFAVQQKRFIFTCSTLVLVFFTTYPVQRRLLVCLFVFPLGHSSLYFTVNVKGLTTSLLSYFIALCIVRSLVSKEFQLKACLGISYALSHLFCRVVEYLFWMKNVKRR